MSLIEGIPSHILQNMASIQSNINSIMANTAHIGASQPGFDNFLQEAVSDISSTFNDDFGGDSNIRFSDQAYPNNPSGSAANIPQQQQLLPNPAISAELARPENPETVTNDSLMNGNIAGMMSSVIGGTDKTNMLEQLKAKVPNIIDKNTSVITDAEFYNAEAMNPKQIDEFLRKKGSPYAYQTFEGGKTAGQLIYEACHNAGTIDKGPKTINPAMMLGILGAEASFGTDPKANKTNPFNIKINGSFHNVNTFESSLKIAVNTMYNWAQRRPEGSQVNLLDYAGDKYCEDYTQNWKPNVEKYYADLTNKYSASPVSRTEMNAGLVNQMLSTLTGASGNGSPNLMAMMQSLTGQGNTGGVDVMSMLKNLTGQQGAGGADMMGMLKGLTGQQAGSTGGLDMMTMMKSLTGQQSNGENSDGLDMKLLSNLNMLSMMKDGMGQPSEDSLF